MANVKCRLYNEGEKVFANFEFDNGCVALDFFKDAENLNGIIEALNEYTEEESEVKSKKTKDEVEANEVEKLAKIMQSIMETSPRVFYDAYNKAVKDADTKGGK
jgi:hypothetical protein